MSSIKETRTGLCPNPPSSGVVVVVVVVVGGLEGEVEVRGVTRRFAREDFRCYRASV